MKRAILHSAIVAGLITSSMAMAAPSYTVTSSANDGPGSLREALASGATVITIDDAVGTIAITETLEYGFEEALRLNGSGQTIDGSGLTDNSAPIFAATMGADLAISDLHFEAGGGYDWDNQGGGKAIFVDVRDDQTGTVSLRLTDVSVHGTGNHGVHVSDCNLADECGGGGGGGGDGSAASVYVELVDVQIDNCGWGKADADGLRVDDRGDGDIIFSSTNSWFTNNGADGVELDEGNNGSVWLEVRNNTFDANGEFCLGDTELADDSPCNDDGDPDVDDAFDVDEAGDGGIYGFARNNLITNNFDEGFDFDEEDEGGFDVVLASNIAIGNADEGVKMSEEDGGDIIATLRSHYSEDNNGGKEGIELEEADGGGVEITVTGSIFVGGGDEELKIEEDDNGSGTVKVRGSTVELDLDGDIDEI